MIWRWNKRGDPGLLGFGGASGFVLVEECRRLSADRDYGVYHVLRLVLRFSTAKGVVDIGAYD